MRIIGDVDGDEVGSDGDGRFGSDSGQGSEKACNQSRGDTAAIKDGLSTSSVKRVSGDESLSGGQVARERSEGHPRDEKSSLGVNLPKESWPYVGG